MRKHLEEDLTRVALAESSERARDKKYFHLFYQDDAVRQKCLNILNPGGRCQHSAWKNKQLHVYSCQIFLDRNIKSRHKITINLHGKGSGSFLENPVKKTATGFADAAYMPDTIQPEPCLVAGPARQLKRNPPWCRTSWILYSRMLHQHITPCLLPAMFCYYPPLNNIIDPKIMQLWRANPGTIL